MKLTKDIFVNLDEVLFDTNQYLAHIDKKNESKKETLMEHTDLCQIYLLMIVEKKGLDSILEQFITLYFSNMSEAGKQLFRKMAWNIITFHDTGKINPRFQKNKMKNSIGREDFFKNLENTHAPLSAVIYIKYFSLLLEMLDNDEMDILSNFLFLNGYIIARHHGDLVSFSKYLDSYHLNKTTTNFGVMAAKIFEQKEFPVIKTEDIMNVDSFAENKRYCLDFLRDAETQEKSLLLYAYEKMMYSLLISCDYYATTEFHNNQRINYFGELDDIQEFYKVYKDTNVYKNIRKYEKDKDASTLKGINVLRTEMFLEVEQELLKHLNESIFYIEAPTGIGKSNVALNLSFRLLEENPTLQKIFYVYPFNTLIEQNIDSINQIFGDNKALLDKIVPRNSANPIFQKLDEGRIKDSYEKSLLDHQFLNYPMILTTHVTLFNIMFGTDKEGASAFYQLCNSVIVLDEIQSYRIDIWTEITMFLKTFAKLLNIKVIIMSATLPDLNYLTDNFDEGISLVKDREKYFKDVRFKNRVVPRYELLEVEEPEEKLLEMIYENVKDGKKILIEFIKKASAERFYNRLKELLKEFGEIYSKVELLTGDSCIYERKKILNKVKETESTGIVLVATQVIEAGVDIDMDIGYKNISKLDSEEQFMGRINRSCNKDGSEVYFFIIDEPRGIYKNDVRVQPEFVVIKEELQELLLKKEFTTYYSLILKFLKKEDESTGEEGLESFYSDILAPMDFKGVEERMKLIKEDDWKMSVFLARQLETDEGERLDGAELWEQYTEILKENKMGYSEKRIELSKVMSKMNHFIYEINSNIDLTYNDRIGDLFYLDEGEQYFEDGKLMRERFETAISRHL